jgi:ADP-dependent NAD(P)H-hydrate dehydratase / NAD(P)H-hydrate epimerase
MAIKILSTEQIREADAYTIAYEPIASTALMEKAGIACTGWILPRLSENQKVCIFCGPGNNGGDGLVIARLLAAAGFQVHVSLLGNAEKRSPDFIINHDLLKEQNLAGINNVMQKSDLPEISPDDLVVDAIFGSGLSSRVNGIFGEAIDLINTSHAVIVAIDIPSGLYSDAPSEPKAGAIVRAAFTLSFQLPRLAFFCPENEDYIGEWEVLDIGLHPDYINAAETNHFLTQEDDLRLIIKPRSRFSHKGVYGHGLLIAGSCGKMGAVVLACRAALRSGAGLITAHIPECGYNILQTAVPEAMVSIDRAEYHFSHLPELNNYSAIAIGPGLGQEAETAKALKFLIQQTTVPLILDADAINILGENKTWLSFLPKGSILSPHLKEFERITRKATNSYDRNQIQREFSLRFGVFVILKGAFTCISFPNGDCYFNPTGNPGMATGGSGDVLTGMLLGLKVQGYTSAETCLLGTYLHGLAGDIAAAEKGFEALIAGDIIESIGDAYNEIVAD